MIRGSHQLPLHTTMLMHDFLFKNIGSLLRNTYVHPVECMSEGSFCSSGYFQHDSWNSTMTK